MKCPKLSLIIEKELNFCIDCGEKSEIKCPQFSRIFHFWQSLARDACDSPFFLKDLLVP